MSKKGKTALVPKLRFPEFRSTGEWTITILEVLADKITTRNQDSRINRVLTNSAVDGVVDQKDYFDRDIANQNNLENYFVINKGDYVYNPRISVTAPVGPISKNKVGKGVMSPLYTVFRFKNHNNNFYEQYFRTNLWHRYLKNVANMGARHDRMSISPDNFMKMPLPCNPDKGNKEQQKIADCLSSIDELIVAEDKKLEGLKAHKKGLLQKMFPADGETVPEYRFPEFTDAWEQRKIANCFTERNERSSIGELISVTMNSGVMKASDLGRHDTSSDDKSNYKKVEVGDIAYNSMRMWQGASGYSPYSGILSPAYTVITPNDDIYSPFFAYLFKRPNMIHTFQICSQGLTSDTWNLKWPALSAITATVPTFAEQEKISGFFAALDRLITLHQRKLELLKEHKKGLMQGLFPSIDEVK